MPTIYLHTIPVRSPLLLPSLTIEKLDLPGIHMNQVAELTLKPGLSDDRASPFTTCNTIDDCDHRDTQKVPRKQKDSTMNSSWLFQGRVDRERAQLDSSGAHHVMAHGQWSQTNPSPCPSSGAHWLCDHEEVPSEPLFSHLLK